MRKPLYVRIQMKIHAHIRIQPQININVYIYLSIYIHTPPHIRVHINIPLHIRTYCFRGLDLQATMEQGWPRQKTEQEAIGNGTARTPVALRYAFCCVEPRCARWRCAPSAYDNDASRTNKKPQEMPTEAAPEYCASATTAPSDFNATPCAPITPPPARVANKKWNSFLGA